MTKKEAESFIYNAKKGAIKLKWLEFCVDTSVENLAYAMKRYAIYDSAVTFFSALYQWLVNGMISPESAYDCAFERMQQITKV